VRKRIQLDYTIYSPNYTRETGECWDFIKFKRAQNKARAFGPGAKIIRNFNQRDQTVELDWWQGFYCWIWDGQDFYRRLPIEEKKWIVPESHWRNASLVKKLRRRRY